MGAREWQKLRLKCTQGVLMVGLTEQLLKYVCVAGKAKG